MYICKKTFLSSFGITKQKTKITTTKYNKCLCEYNCPIYLVSLSYSVDNYANGEK